ncbi:MAG: [FeFe] hydrogenase H-cluster radical SAM maturase HydE [Elusimicrobiota bacterium]|nr:[FeFe] hydrogenase H-cluster radical SAM maturase HydE [Elusimicrobiota bacterium]
MPIKTETSADIVKLLALTDERAIGVLFAYADAVRKKEAGDEVHLRAIIEFSNYCVNDCLYCGLRKSRKNLHRYRMTDEEILAAVRKADELGYKTVVLQSGDDLFYSADDISCLVGKIKNQFDMAVTLSCGERSFEEYKEMRAAGADRYLLKHETANKKLYEKLHPGQSFEMRLKILGWLKELGFQTGSGSMVGLPGQTLEDIAEDILLFKKMDIDMIGIGPFIPHGDTPLAGSSAGTADMVLKTLAITRIVTRNTHLPATTALETIDPLGGQKALECGANVIMPNLTPQKYREDYQIYPGKICVFETADDCASCVRGMVKSIGRTVSSGRGDSLKIKKTQ